MQRTFVLALTVGKIPTAPFSLYKEHLQRSEKE
jgi:hypothetical protein